ncbi:hypothetical protein CP533_6823 [Ophiocordyceps camponoti-saundersi (nom. inval.)]|nr:hypothetical protein CP533_6823 [Ophiocordyceps camponoti-saundersi (nom. inval.)]
MQFKTAALIAIVAAAQGVFGSACIEQQVMWDKCKSHNKPGSYDYLQWCLCVMPRGLFHQAWKCSIEKAVGRAGGNEHSREVALEDMYWKQYYVEFKFRYCQDPDGKFNGNYQKAWESHDNIWKNRNQLTSI